MRARSQTRSISITCSSPSGSWSRIFSRRSSLWASNSTVSKGSVTARLGAKANAAAGLTPSPPADRFASANASRIRSRNAARRLRRPPSSWFSG